MSLLSKFFETRHQNDDKDQSNSALISIFSTPVQLPKPQISTKTKIIKKQFKPAKTMQKQQNDENEEQNIQSKKSRKKQKRVPQQTEQQIQDNEQVLKKNKERKQKSKNKKLKTTAAQPNSAKTEQNKIEQNKNEEPQNLDSTVFVGNVALSSTHKSIKKYFEKYGKVVKVWFRSIPVEQSKIPRKGLHILKKYQEGADSMNAYVKFQKQEEASAACQANGQQIEGKNIKVTLCNNFDIDYQTTIFIGNLPRKINDQQLWDAFKGVGKVKSVRVIRNKDTLQGIGIGYVRFETKQEMRKAIQDMNGKKIGDRAMRIKKAVSKQRMQKKVRKLKQKKDNKFKASKNIRPQSDNKQRDANSRHPDNSSYPQKTKKIQKASIPRTAKNGKKDGQHTQKQYKGTEYTRPTFSGNEQSNSNQIIRTKYGFKGTKISLQ